MYNIVYHLKTFYGRFFQCEMLGIKLSSNYRTYKPQETVKRL